MKRWLDRVDIFQKRFSSKTNLPQLEPTGFRLGLRTRSSAKGDIAKYLIINGQTFPTFFSETFLFCGLFPYICSPFEFRVGKDGLKGVFEQKQTGRNTGRAEINKRV
jgi:hypothetical protein